MEPLLPPIVSPEWLAADQRRRQVVLADVRWYLDGRSGLEAYRAGHLPGAVWIDVDDVLADPPSPAAGRHPLPDPERFADGLSRAGIGDGSIVVAYDDLGGMAAGRLVWLLRALGEAAALLDGGLPQNGLPQNGLPGHEGLRSGDERLPPARFTPRPWPADLVASAEETAAAAAAGRLVLDARAAERYRGEVEPIDARPGHVPGARNAPFAANLDPASGRFLPPGELRRRYEALGVHFDGADSSPGEVGDVIVYCGSGVSACHDLLALEAAGLPLGHSRLYAGSWSQWAADRTRPAALGDEPAPAD